MCIVSGIPPSYGGTSGIRLKDMEELVGRGNISGMEVRCANAGDSIPLMFGRELKAEFGLAGRVMRLWGDVVLWKGRSSTFILPMLVSKLRGKKSILLIESRGDKLAGQVYRSRVVEWLYMVVEDMAWSLADRLVVNVPGLLEDEWLKMKGDKVFPFPLSARVVGNEFKIDIPINERATVVGFIGRLSREKGILQFVEAIEYLPPELRVMIIGGGPLESKIKGLGRVEHEDIPGYLNRMRLLVIPSDYEGLPTVALEAMFCGTPILATRVGALKDLVKDGRTGFLMENNSPKWIAMNIARALSSNLEEVSKKALDLVRREYSTEVMKERWQILLGGM